MSTSEPNTNLTAFSSMGKKRVMEVDGLEMAFVDQGDGPLTFVLLHGNPTSNADSETTSALNAWRSRLRPPSPGRIGRIAQTWKPTPIVRAST
jgi:hypothetical protein